MHGCAAGSSDLEADESGSGTAPVACMHGCAAGLSDSGTDKLCEVIVHSMSEASTALVRFATCADRRCFFSFLDHTLEPLKLCALEIFLGYASP
jgi:hypothetical protein